jgi:hypothetical protein
MPNIGFQVQVPASPEQVFEYVTRFPVTGRPSRSVLEDRYGRLLEQDGQDYTFQDDANEELRWRCTFDPPRQRAMRLPETNWADRLDWFEPSELGTVWTILWELKTTGMRSYTQWLTFQLTGKRRTYHQVVAPVLQHFGQAAAPPVSPEEPVGEIGSEATGDFPAHDDGPTAEEMASAEPGGTDAPASPETARRPRVRRRRRS